LIHIWDHVKLETISELRKEQFGSDVSLLSFSPKPDDNFILIVSSDKPKNLLVVDWKRQEIIFNIVTKSDKILSALFVFDTIEWIGCVSQQHLLFYNINWNSKPLRVGIQRESEVQVTIDFYMIL
jgi:WD40 repeat protein